MLAAYGSAGTAYLLNVQSSGSTASGWTDTGTIDWNNGTALFGATPTIQIVYGATNETLSSTFSAQNEVRVRIAFRYSATPSSGALYLFSFWDGSSEICDIDINNTDGKLNANNFGAGGSFIGTTADATSPNTDYYIWIHYKVGSGTAVFTVAFSTTNSEPVSGNAFIGTTTDSMTNTITGVVLRNRDSTTNNPSANFNDIKATSGAVIT